MLTRQPGEQRRQQRLQPLAVRTGTVRVPRLDRRLEASDFMQKNWKEPGGCRVRNTPTWAGTRGWSYVENGLLLGIAIMIEIAHGNILEADAEALVNTVNCIGVIGKAWRFSSPIEQRWQR